MGSNKNRISKEKESFLIDEYLSGLSSSVLSDNQNQYPYLTGWVNSIKSAMAYTSKTKLQ